MLYRDVNCRLDMRFVVSIEQKHTLISMIEREYQTVPLHIDNTGTEAYVDLFLQTNGNRQIDNIMSNYTTVTNGDLRVVHVRANEVETASSIIDQIASLKSVLPAGLYLTGNKIMAGFRFHHSENDAVSSIAKKIVSSKSHIAVRDLGPDPGGIAAIDEMNLRISLSVVSYEVNAGRKAGSKIPDVIYESKFADFKGSETGALVFSDPKDPERDIGTPISAEDGIYLSSLDSSFFQEVWKLTNESHIPRAAILVKPTPRGFRTFSFLPSTLVSEYLSILFRVSEKFPDAGFNLSTVRVYDKSIWDWI